MDTITELAGNIVDEYWAADQAPADLALAEVFIGQDGFKECSERPGVDGAIITREDGECMVLGLDYEFEGEVYDDILEDWVKPEADGWSYSRYASGALDDSGCIIDDSGYITTDGDHGDIDTIAPKMVKTVIEWLRAA